MLNGGSGGGRKKKSETEQKTKREGGEEEKRGSNDCTATVLFYSERNSSSSSSNARRHGQQNCCTTLKPAHIFKKKAKGTCTMVRYYRAKKALTAYHTAQLYSSSRAETVFELNYRAIAPLLLLSTAAKYRCRCCC